MTESRSLRGKTKISTPWATKTPAERRAATKKARDAYLKTYEDKVDPKHELGPRVRRKRAEEAIKAHMRSMALKASHAASAKRAAIKAAKVQEAGE